MLLRRNLLLSLVLLMPLAVSSCSGQQNGPGGEDNGGAPGIGGSSTVGGTSGVKVTTGGASSNTGGATGVAVSTGGSNTAAGGAATGGTQASGTVATGGTQANGGSATGGTRTNGGAAAGGTAAGGAAAGGAPAGGSATGGSANGGSTNGTKATGGAAAGGKATGGAPNVGGGATTGGSVNGGTTSTAAGGAGGYTKPAQPPADEDGSLLWLRYVKVPIAGRLAEYQAAVTQVVKAGSSDTLQAAQSELVKGLGGLLGTTITVADQPTGNGAVIVGTPTSSTLINSLSLGSSLTAVGNEGYLVKSTTVGGNAAIVVAANTDVGALRGSFALLRQMQCHRTLQGLSLSESPKIQRRILDHWDNLDGTIERGYAGKSIWGWSSLPGTISQRYKDYARANASIGINGVVLNNVNADSQILTSSYLDKVAALATAFRPYGITVYLSAQFGAPKQIGGLSTADPLDSSVKQWWVTEANTIYQKIPDFGGFLVKANSEGQPGPADYGRTHADGANMLQAALSPHGGIVMWRAFVYSDNGADRIGQAYTEFKPLDGKFNDGTMVQVKNGPLDFQPREPFHPLFGAMPSTPLALELQITKEYLGEDTHLAYLGTMWQEVLQADTYAKGQGSTVARVIDGTLHGYKITAIAGVSGIGNDTNWMGSHFNQANWYAFGRLAWNPDMQAQDIADEWIRQTFSNDPTIVTPVTQMMMNSRQNLVSYMEPIGLVHIMGTTHHYGPAPWVNNLSQANWNPFYYHKADSTGIGFDRTSTGSNTVSQYFSTVANQFASKSTVPDNFLLFFQRMKWTDTLASSGRTIWNELVYRYSAGVDAVQTMRNQWTTVQGYIDTKRFNDVTSFLQIQHYEARWWRDACLTYFMSVNKLTMPSGYSAPAQNLAYYQNLQNTCPSDATKPRCPAINTGNPSPAITP
jgi:alpha-glucuronidase